MEPAFKSVLDSLVTGDSVLKYASLKVINRVASFNPKEVSLSSSEIEPLINDPNTSIASMAISTLLKVCTEAYVQKLLAQITHYLPDLGDDFKIEVIHSVYLLFCRVPSKSTEQINFLLKCLTGEGTEAYKESIVETLMKIGMEGLTADKEQVLLTLCEFIEDCEFKHLQTHILDFIAKESPFTSNPSVYIRFIYNRVVLEKSIIRAAAVSALGAIGHKIDNLRSQIVILLKNCLKDENDEVRERALFYTSLLDYSEEDEADVFDTNTFVFDHLNFDYNKMETYLIENKDKILEDEDSDEMLSLETFYSEEEESVLTKVIQREEEHKEEIFNVQKDLHSPLEESIEQMEEIGQSAGTSGFSLPSTILQKLDIEAVDFSTGVSNITSPGDEYYVQLTKHFYGSKIIFQFKVENNIEEHKLSSIKAHLESPILDFEVVGEVPGDEGEFTVIVLEPKDRKRRFVTGEFKFKLSFVVTEVDHEGNEEGSYDDEYELDKVRIVVPDYVGKQELLR